ncbi:MAG: ATP-binding cassette domain-containing protein [Armatimonadota bacterium]|nr:ATP-binding cassette domain-containing protein [Armatimonadota bacterium]
MALLEVENLVKHFPITRSVGPFKRVTEALRAVDGVDLTLDTGETLGLVGESGCGKSTLGRCILRLIEPTSGAVRFAGQDILTLPPEALRKQRQAMQVVFQDPFASLNPRMSIGAILEEPLRVHKVVPLKDVRAEVARLLEQVGLAPEAARRFPHEFSGGQRQRVGIARALSLRPKLIVADEPVSALDVSIRAQILNLFAQLQQETGVALLFIAHDLGAVRQISQRVAVMYLGKIVEIAPSDELYDNPRHPYTRALLAAVPSVEGKKAVSEKVEGDVPSPIDIPTGCRFRSRCPFAQDICATQEPLLAPFAGGPSMHLSACHFAATLPTLTT